MPSKLISRVLQLLKSPCVSHALLLVQKSELLGSRPTNPVQARFPFQTLQFQDPTGSTTGKEDEKRECRRRLLGFELF